MQVGNRHWRRIGVRWKQARTSNERIDQCTLARLGLPDHRNPAGIALRIPHELIQRSCGLVIQEWPQLGCQSKGGHCDFAQLLTNSRLRACRGFTIVNGKR